MLSRPQWIQWLVATLREAAWAPLSVFGSYLLALTFHLFKLFPPLDIPFHFLGGMTIAYFYRSAIRNSQELVGEVPVPVQILFAFTCAATTAVLWEFNETLLDLCLGTHMVRGLQDTIMDLFLGLLGALIFSICYRRH